MNITSDVKDAKLTATVTIPAADVDAIIKKAYKAAAKQYRFPGFRAGKAPRPVIDSALGKDAVLAQATNELIGSNEGNVLNELDIVPVKEGDDQEIDLCADGTDYTYTVRSPCARPLSSPPTTPSRSRCPRRSPRPRSTSRSTCSWVTRHLRGRRARRRGFRLRDRRHQERRERRGARRRGPRHRHGRRSPAQGVRRGPAGHERRRDQDHLLDPRGRGCEEASVEVTVKGVKERKLPELNDEFEDQLRLRRCGRHARRREARDRV